MHTYVLTFTVWKQNTRITNLDNFSVMLWGLFSTACIYHMSGFASLSAQNHIFSCLALQTPWQLFNVALYPYSFIANQSFLECFGYEPKYLVSHTLCLIFAWIPCAGLCTAWNDCRGDDYMPIPSVPFLSFRARDLTLEFSSTSARGSSLLFLQRDTHSSPMIKKMLHFSSERVQELMP